MKGASVKIAILSCYSMDGPYFHHVKNQPPQTSPFKLFWTLTLILAKLKYKECDEKFVVQNLGLNHLKKCIFCLLDELSEWEKSFYFCPLFIFFKTPLNLLTYSAMQCLSK